jgi:transposase
MTPSDPTDRPIRKARTRFRCASCGNLTRFDVYETRRTRAYHHFTLGGDLSIDEEEVLEANRERVTCRWCGSSEAIEELPVHEAVPVEAGSPAPAPEKLPRKP